MLVVMFLLGFGKPNPITGEPASAFKFYSAPAMWILDRLLRLTLFKESNILSFLAYLGVFLGYWGMVVTGMFHLGRSVWRNAFHRSSPR